MSFSSSSRRRGGILSRALVAAAMLGVSCVATVTVQMTSTQIAGASVSSTIPNLPASGKVGGSFTPTVSTALSGATSVSSATPLVCDVAVGVVRYLAAGTCTLVSHVVNASYRKVASIPNWPADVAVNSSGQFYVAELFDGSVSRFDSDGSNRTVINGSLNFPYAVSVDSSDNVHIADTNNNQIIKVLTNGTQITIAPTIGGRSLNGPQGVAADSAGNIYVSDTGNNQIVKLAPNGSGGYTATVLMNSISAPNKIKVDKAGHLFVLSPPANSVITVNTDGTGRQTIASNFINPLGMDIDDSGHVFVADTYNHRVVEMNTDGSNQQLVGGAFPFPWGIAVDGSGHAIVADASDKAIYSVGVDGSPQSFTVIPAAPAAPTNVSVTPGNNQLTVSWTNPPSNGNPAVYNKVEFSVDANPPHASGRRGGAPIRKAGTNPTTWTTASATVPPGDTSYTVTGLSNGTAYDVRVTALDGSGASSDPAGNAAPIAPNVQYTVTYKNNAGTSTYSSESGASASYVTLPSSETASAGYHFAGWATSSGSSTVAYSPGTSYPLTGDATLYAVFTANATDTITLKNNDGTSTYGTPRGLDGTSITLPSSETAAAGYHFAGWATSSSSSSVAYSADLGWSYLLAGDATLYAVFTANATDTITLKNNDGTSTYDTPSGLDGTSITLPSSETGTAGYSFAGWATSSGSSTVAYGPGANYVLGGNASLFAVFTADVTFGNNDGSTTYSVVTGAAGQVITLPMTARAPSGFHFIGWATSAGSYTVDYGPGARYTVAGGATLFAVFEADPVDPVDPPGGTSDSPVVAETLAATGFPLVGSGGFGALVLLTGLIMLLRRRNRQREDVPA